MVGTTLRGIERDNERRLLVRRVVREGGEELLDLPVDRIEVLGATSGTGGNAVFILGLHSPFDAHTTRNLKF